jgi:hypothetical protein
MASRKCLDTQLKNTFVLQKEDYVNYNYQVYVRNLVCCCPVLWPMAIAAPCEYQNLADYADAVTVGTTGDSLVFCKQKTKTCWRCSPCDSGKVVKEIPFDKITDVVIVEPAGGCCPAEILYRIYIQTAGRSGVEGAELTIVGLTEKDAYSLRSLIKSKGKGGAKNKGMERV